MTRMSIAVAIIAFAWAGAASAASAADSTGGCVPAAGLTRAVAPPALATNAVQCWEAGRQDDAGTSWTLFKAFASFDARRVADRSAHSVVSVLQMQTAQRLGDDVQRFLDAANDPAKRDTGCTALRSIGAPTYEPDYMTSHGMSAFLGPRSAEGPPFDAVAAWTDILEQGFKCSAAAGTGTPAR